MAVLRRGPYDNIVIASLFFRGKIKNADYPPGYRGTGEGAATWSGLATCSVGAHPEGSSGPDHGGGGDETGTRRQETAPQRTGSLLPEEAKQLQVASKVQKGRTVTPGGSATRTHQSGLVVVGVRLLAVNGGRTAPASEAASEARPQLNTGPTASALHGRFGPPASGYRPTVVCRPFIFGAPQRTPTDRSTHVRVTGDRSTTRSLL